MDGVISFDAVNMQRRFSIASAGWAEQAPPVPNISGSDTFIELLDKLSLYVCGVTRIQILKTLTVLLIVTSRKQFTLFIRGKISKQNGTRTRFLRSFNICQIRFIIAMSFMHSCM